MNNIMKTWGISLLLACWWAGLYIAVLQISLPPTDGAYGKPLWQILCDPFVLTVAVPVALVSGTLAAPLYWWCLRNKNFQRSILAIWTAVSLELITVTPFDSQIGFRGAYVVLFAGLLFLKRSNFTSLLADEKREHQHEI